eukprot:24985_1
MLSWLTIVANIASLQAVTNHVIDLYKTPIGDIGHAYPLDVCVNTEISGLGMNPWDYQYVIYSCNVDQTAVRKISFNTDSTCSSGGSIAETYSDTTIAAGELHSFNCEGEINFVVTASYTNHDTCCGNPDVRPAIVPAATGVCFAYGDGNYSRASCSADGGGVQYKYPTNQCVDANKLEPPPYQYDASCGFWKKVSIVDVYIRSDQCFMNATAIACNTLCSDGARNCVLVDYPDFDDDYFSEQETTSTGDDDDSKSHSVCYLFGLITLVVAVLWQ